MSSVIWIPWVYKREHRSVSVRKSNGYGSQWVYYYQLYKILKVLKEIREEKQCTGHAELRLSQNEMLFLMFLR